jgi:hypothetical protein
MAAYRRGLTRALDELAAERSNVEVAHLAEVDHMSIAGRHAGDVAAIVRSFVAAR